MTHNQETFLHVLEQFLAAKRLYGADQICCFGLDRRVTNCQIIFTLLLLHSKLHKVFATSSILLKDIDTATKLFNLDTANDPGPDPLHKHIVLVFSAEH